MKNLVILTTSFPYEGGEQFIESEVHYWAMKNFDNVYILPEISSTKTIRYFPKELILLQRLKITFNSKIFILFFILFYSLFWREIFYLIKNNCFNTVNIINAIRTVVGVKVREKQLKYSLKKIDGDTLIYSYWNDVDFYAACELKKKKKIKIVVSRAHRYDLYKEFRENSYMPLKHQYSKVVDKVFLLTESAKKYYSRTYEYSNNVLDVARLGVFMPEKILPYDKSSNVLRVLSVSNCIKIKRVDKIINALNNFSEVKKKEVHWTHVGNGVLLEELKQQAREVDGNRLFKYNFLGFLPNSEVKKLLAEQSFDLFINTSESEGVPVSIMEAMSYSIPVIAPNVGEISDIVNSSTGKLLSSNPAIKEIVDGICEVYSSKDYKSYRKRAFLMVKENYNADINYANFINKLSQIEYE